MIVCPSCEGTKTMTAEVSDYINGKNVKNEKLSALKLPCGRCDATGEIELDQIIKEQQESECWCQCEEIHESDFHDDGNHQEYGDGFTCDKHHYSCTNCNLITQIG